VMLQIVVEVAGTVCGAGFAVFSLDWNLLSKSVWHSRRVHTKH